MLKNKWYFKLLISLISGLTMAYAWYPHGFVCLAFVAFVPLLYLSDVTFAEGRRNQFGRGIGLFYPAFFIFNAVTTYWIAFCTVPGAVAAILLNALFQSMVFALWHCLRKQIPVKSLQYILLVCLFVSFEYLHLNWELTWPWLNLGNVFATVPALVQWYSVTGATGGTIWVLVTNVLLYLSMVALLERHVKRSVAAVMSAVGLFLILVVLSLVMMDYAEEHISRENAISAVIVQPDTDPWIEEYRLTNEEEIERILSVAGPYIDENTNLVIAPESAIAHTINVSELRSRRFDPQDSRYSGFSLFDSIIETYPNLNFITGLSTFDQKKRFYNSAGHYNTEGLSDIYHKSRLVPGVESMPYPKIFGFLGEIMLELGGANTSLATDTGQRVFKFRDGNETIGIGSAICYESVYGELVGNFVRGGANILSVITNDSWWEDSPGHVQHFEMARLRAVETRRYVLRAANGGFSGVISPLGQVVSKTNYGERTAIYAQVYPQYNITFYAKHGDYLSVISTALSILGCFAAIVMFFVNIIKKRKVN